MSLFDDDMRISRVVLCGAGLSLHSAALDVRVWAASASRKPKQQRREDTIVSPKDEKKGNSVSWTGKRIFWEVKGSGSKRMRLLC